MSPEDEQLERRAEVCLRTGLAPSEYDRMTDHEINVWIAVHNRLTEEE